MGAGAASDRANQDEWLSLDLGKAVLTPAGAILGATIGALVPGGGWKKVYEAQRINDFWMMARVRARRRTGDLFVAAASEPTRLRQVFRGDFPMLSGLATPAERMRKVERNREARIIAAEAHRYGGFHEQAARQQPGCA